MFGLSNAFPAPAPQPLRALLTGVPNEHQPLSPATKDFRLNIRAYNSALQMASTGLHIHSPEQGISMIAIKGAVHHLLGPLQPAEHDVPQFAQLYIIDSMDAQVIARLAALGATSAALHQPTLAGLQQMLHDHNTFVVATPLWPSVGVKPNTWKSWRLGVFRDSRMFRARQQGAKHLALGCSWCHWKGLETQISKMPSHWQFGHLQPKLWAKEGPGVKLAV
jgi:hypothetical protein